MRPSEIIEDRFGNEITLPTTVEANDWFAECKCGQICGGTFGVRPSDDDRKYIACPACGCSGEPDILWREANVPSP